MDTPRVDPHNPWPAPGVRRKKDRERERKRDGREERDLVRKEEKENERFPSPNTTELAFAGIPMRARVCAHIFRTSRRGVCFSPGREITGDIFETGLMFATGSRSAEFVSAGVRPVVWRLAHAARIACIILMQSYPSEHARQIPPVCTLNATSLAGTIVRHLFSLVTRSEIFVPTASSTHVSLRFSALHISRQSRLCNQSHERGIAFGSVYNNPTFFQVRSDAPRKLFYTKLPKYLASKDITVIF